MMDYFKFFDTYSLRARLFPAIIAAAPAFAAIALLISWKSFEISNAIATIAAVVMLYAIADFARWRGRRIEPILYAEQGGMPSVTIFRRNDSTINENNKQRYREFLSKKLKVAVPTEEVENSNQVIADSFYEQCGVWLRQNTRDTKKFPLLFNENLTYGFRRNLFGVKWLALGLNVAVVIISLILLHKYNWDWSSDLGKRTTLVLVIAATHAAYILIAVRKALVFDASETYARELLLSCESFLTERMPTKEKSKRKAPSRDS
jgi:hypothetical protein